MILPRAHRDSDIRYVRARVLHARDDVRDRSVRTHSECALQDDFCVRVYVPCYFSFFW